MGKKYELLLNNINEGKYTGREILLSGAVLILTGALLGMIFSPRKNQVIGSNNGNWSCNGNEAQAKKQKDLFALKCQKMLNQLKFNMNLIGGIVSNLHS